MCDALGTNVLKYWEKCISRSLLLVFLPSLKRMTLLVHMQKMDCPYDITYTIFLMLWGHRSDKQAGIGLGPLGLINLSNSDEGSSTINECKLV